MRLPRARRYLGGFGDVGVTYDAPSLPAAPPAPPPPPVVYPIYPAPPPVPCAPLPPPTPLPNVPGNPMAARGYACAAGVPVGTEQRHWIDYVNDLQSQMEHATGTCQVAYGSKIAAIRANCGSPADLHATEAQLLQCMGQALDQYVPGIAKGMQSLDSSCYQAAQPPPLSPPPLPPAPPPLPVQSAPESTPLVIDVPPLPDVTTPPAPATKKASMAMGGILLLLVVGGGYAIWRTMRRQP